MAQTMEQLRGAEKLKDAKWVRKEQSYRTTIQQLEARVGYVLDCTHGMRSIGCMNEPLM